MSIQIILFSFFIFQFPLFREGRWGSGSTFSLHTSRFSITSFISLRLSPKRFHPRPLMWFSQSLGRPTGLLPLGMADRACFESLSWGILLTWPNHLSCDLLMRKSSDSTFSEVFLIFNKIIFKKLFIITINFQFLVFFFCLKVARLTLYFTKNKTAKKFKSTLKY